MKSTTQRRRRVARLAAVATATTIVASPMLTANAQAAALDATDTGLDYSLDIPAVDLSTVDVSRVGSVCQVGNIGMQIHIARTKGLTTATESASATASSTCNGIKLVLSILDQAKPTGPSQGTAGSRTSTGRSVGASAAQTVEWIGTGPLTVRPLSVVAFKATATSNGKSNCFEVDVTVVAGSDATETPVPC